MTVFRNCGRVYCSDCTNNKASVPNQQLNEPVRVCNNCFSELMPFDDVICVKGNEPLKTDDLEAALLEDEDDAKLNPFFKSTAQ